MRILTIDTALPACAVALVEDDRVWAERRLEVPRGLAGLLPPLLAGLLAEAPGFGLVACCVGPGSFTGLRVGLSLAHGLALARDVAVIGVTSGEALSLAVGPLDGPLWVATPARPGRVFLEHDGRATGMALDALPLPPPGLRLAGPAAEAVAAAWRHAGAECRVLDGARHEPRHLAAAALLRRDGVLAPRDALPLYVDPPEAALPRGGLRPAPA